MIVDPHAHLTPPILLMALGGQLDRFPNVDLLEEDGKYRLALMGQSPTRPM